MIIFGWGKNCKEIGKGLIRECPNCKNIRQWVIVQTSKKVTLYFVPVAKWNKEYFFICPVCNNGIQLNNLDDAHKIMEAALEQEAELKKLYSETENNSDYSQSNIPLEEKTVLEGEIFVGNGLWECKNCHIKMLEEGDYCSKCRGHKQDVAKRYDNSDYSQSDISLEKGEVLNDIIYVENGLWECNICHIKMLLVGDLCSKCRSHKKDIAVRKLK